MTDCPTPRKRRSLARLVRFTAACIASCASFAHSDAAILVYEPFDYVPGNQLNGQSGGYGFGSVPSDWVDVDQAGDPEPIASGSLNYAQNGVSLAIKGQRVRSYAEGIDAESSSFGRDIFGILPADQSVYWSSFVVRREMDTNPSSGYVSYCGLRLISGSRTISFGTDGMGSANPNFGVFGSTGTTQFGMLAPSASQVAVSIGTPHLLVLKMTFNAAGADNFRFFIDPTPGLTPMDSEANMLLSFELPSITAISYGTGEGSGPGVHEWSLDEFRLGETYLDVAPVATPEPGAIGLLTLGAAALGVPRMRRG